MEIIRKFECDYISAEKKKIEEGIKSLDGPTNTTTEDDETSEAEPSDPLSGIMIEEKTIFRSIFHLKTVEFRSKLYSRSSLGLKKGDT